MNLWVHELLDLLSFVRNLKHIVYTVYCIDSNCSFVCSNREEFQLEVPFNWKELKPGVGWNRLGFILTKILDHVEANLNYSACRYGVCTRIRAPFSQNTFFWRRRQSTVKGDRPRNATHEISPTMTMSPDIMDIHRSFVQAGWGELVDTADTKIGRGDVLLVLDLQHLGLVNCGNCCFFLTLKKLTQFAQSFIFINDH